MNTVLLWVNFYQAYDYKRYLLLLLNFYQDVNFIFFYLKYVNKCLVDRNFKSII